MPYNIEGGMRVNGLTVWAGQGQYLRLHTLQTIELIMMADGLKMQDA